MAEPISDLTSLLVADSGIKLSWTAASDATNGSIYELYTLQNGQYVETTYLKPVPYKPQGTSVYSLNPPATEFTFPWQMVLALGDGLRPPIAVTFQITHVASDLSESTPVSITAYPPAVDVGNSVPHLLNGIQFDPYGQVMTSDQDSSLDVSSCVEMIIGTIPGQRSMVPLLGVDDLAETQIDTAQIQNSIREWEPRANVNVSVQYDNANNAFVSVNLQEE